MTHEIDFRRLFREEARDYLTQARERLESSESLDEAGVFELRRLAHSVKGMAASCGERAIADAMHRAEELLAAGPHDHQEAILTAVHDALARLVDVDGDTDNAPVAEPRHVVSPRVAVDATTLDKLLESSIDLVLSYQRLEHVLGPPGAFPEVLEARSLLDRAISGIREEILELRWVPVRDLVPILEDSIKRSAERRGALVSFVVKGRATRIDRAVFQGLVEPLRQLVRNAVVHGIESPEQRASVGKPERGSLRLSFDRKGSRLVVKVEDDGRGIDAEALGLAAGAKFEDSQLHNLLTSPGVSRQRFADHDSGRGIGLSAVRRAIVELGGNLSLESVPGARFTATIAVPLRVATVDAFVTRTEGRALAIPVEGVAKVEKTRGDEQPLAIRLGYGEKPGRPDRTVSRFRIELHGVEPPFAVDEIDGPHELIVRNLETRLVGTTPPWAGIAVLPQGGLALLLDPVRIGRTVPAGDAIRAW